MAGGRHEARERALSLLYESEMKGAAIEDVLDDLPLPPDSFVVDVLRGVGAHQARIDELIERFAIDWELDRMPVVDRNVLRVGIYELLERPDIPVGVAISEAVELAKRFSTDESGRFVNGVLSSVASAVRPEHTPPATIDT
jgi:N utilization substance protein B